VFGLELVDAAGDGLLTPGAAEVRRGLPSRLLPRQRQFLFEQVRRGQRLVQFEGLLECPGLELSPEYGGLIIGLAIEPVAKPRPDEAMTIKSIVLAAKRCA
jgi:hypothetical protein